MKDKKHQVSDAELEAHKKQKLRALQKKWYAKLKASGFEDLESQDKSGDPAALLLGKNSAHLRLKLPTMNETYHFYSRLRNFVTHNYRWPYAPFERYCAALYSEGVGLPKIIKQGKANPRMRAYHTRFNLFAVHTFLKKFFETAKLWNKTDPRGLDYEPDL